MLLFLDLWNLGEVGGSGVECVPLFAVSMNLVVRDLVGDCYRCNIEIGIAFRILDLWIPEYLLWNIHYLEHQYGQYRPSCFRFPNRSTFELKQ